MNVLVVSVDADLGAAGQASFVVPRDWPGVTIRQRPGWTGRRVWHTAEMILDDCRVPGRYLLGGKQPLDQRLARTREGSIAPIHPATDVFDSSRPAIGAQAVGISRAAYEYALGYAEKSTRYGRPIVQDQAIASRLAKMKTRSDAARLLVWRASWISAGNSSEAAEGAMAQRYASENAVWVTDQAIQVARGEYYRPNYPLWRWHRDARLLTTLTGASELRRMTAGTADFWSMHGGTRAAID